MMTIGKMWLRTSGVRRSRVVASDGESVGIVAIDDVLIVLSDGLRDLTSIIAREQAREAHAR